MTKSFFYLIALVTIIALWSWLFNSTRTEVGNAVKTFEQKDSSYVIVYVSSITCGICTKPSVIKSISQIPNLISRYHIPVRYVFVSMDMLDDEGWKFAKRHGKWDEISVGGRYYNEVLLFHFNDVEGIIPGVPQIIIYKDYYTYNNFNIPVLKRRKLMKSILGEKAILEWIQQKCPMPL